MCVLSLILHGIYWESPGFLCFYPPMRVWYIWESGGQNYPYLGIDNPQFPSDCSEGVGSDLPPFPPFYMKQLQYPFLPSSKFITCREWLCYLDASCLCRKGCSCCDRTYGLYVTHHVLAIIVLVVLDDLISARNLSQCRAAARYRDAIDPDSAFVLLHPFATFHSFAMCPSFDRINQVWPSLFKLVSTVRKPLSLMFSPPPQTLHHSDTILTFPLSFNRLSSRSLITIA